MMEDLAAMTLMNTGTEVPLTAEEKNAIKTRYSTLIAQGKKESMSFSKEVLAEFCAVSIPDRDSELRRSLPELTKLCDVDCKISKYPFAIGGARAAYHGRIKQHGTSDSWGDVVLKKFMFADSETEASYITQAENSAVAAYLAEKYCATHRVSKRIGMYENDKRTAQFNCAYNITTLYSPHFVMQ